MKPLKLLDTVKVNGTNYTVAGRSEHSGAWHYDLYHEDDNGHLVIVYSVVQTRDWEVISRFVGEMCLCVKLPRWGLPPTRNQNCPHTEDDLKLEC